MSREQCSSRNIHEPIFNPFDNSSYEGLFNSSQKVNFHESYERICNRSHKGISLRYHMGNCLFRKPSLFYFFELENY